MKKTIIKTLIMLITINLLVSITGCNKSSKNIENYKKNGKIVMGTNAQFPPFEYYENERIVGFDTEIGQKIAEKLEVELIIEDINFSTLLDSLSKDKVDFVLSGMTINDTRKSIVDFSNPYYTSGQTIITMNDNTTINSINDLENKKIGIQEKTTGQEEAEKINNAIVSKYNTILSAIMDMKSGNIDAIIFDEKSAKKFVEQNPDIKIVGGLLTTENYGVAVKKGELELLSVINEVIQEINANGEYTKLVDKYLK